MEATYYIPRKPESIPLIDEKNKTATIMIDGETIDIPLPLFKKLFEVEQKSIESELSIVRTTKDMIDSIKAIGMPKDDFFKMMENSLDDRGLSIMRKDIEDLINKLW